MSIDFDILDWHREIAIQALEGAAFQCAAAARLLSRNHDQPAIETYKRVMALHREFVAPSLKIIGGEAPSAQAAPKPLDRSDANDVTYVRGGAA